MLVRFAQLWNVLSPIFVTPVGMLISVRLLLNMDLFLCHFLQLFETFLFGYR